MGYAVRMLLPLVQVPVTVRPGRSRRRHASHRRSSGSTKRPRPSPPRLMDCSFVISGLGPASADDMRAWSGWPSPMKEAVDGHGPTSRSSAMANASSSISPPRRGRMQTRLRRFAGSGIRQRRPRRGPTSAPSRRGSPARILVSAAHRRDGARGRLRGRHVEGRSHEEGRDAHHRAVQAVRRESEEGGRSRGRVAAEVRGTRGPHSRSALAKA